MKKIIVVIFIVVLLAISLNSTSPSQMRIRIIANSDTKDDQELKYKVVDYLRNKKISIDELDILQNDVAYFVKKNNYDYKVNVKIEKQNFPTKSYNEKIVSGGVYETLVIEIGEAKGKNYWSILYPEYFSVSFEEVNTNDVVYKSWFKQLLLGE